jgi:carbon storage regulator
MLSARGNSSTTLKWLNHDVPKEYQLLVFCRRYRQSEGRQFMLVLKRKVGQQIRINENVAVRVLHIQGDSVRLGLSGPPDVPIHREEVYQRIAAESIRPLAVK